MNVSRIGVVGIDATTDLHSRRLGCPITIDCRIAALYYGRTIPPFRPGSHPLLGEAQRTFVRSTNPAVQALSVHI